MSKMFDKLLIKSHFSVKKKKKTIKNKNVFDHINYVSIHTINV